MATCPKCFTRYPDDVVACEVEGEALVPDAAIAALDRDVPAGEMIGEYRVETKLGEGGFGAVYRAVQPLIGKQVAIKILSRKLSSDPEMVSRFVAEARAVNKIGSKHIVDIFGFGSMDDGRQYYVMELLRGATLEDFVKQRGPLPVSEAVQVMRGIARALDAAHVAGIVHRDLKPENVFLVQEEDGVMVPKLLDFGIAKLMSGATGSHKTRTGVPMGTPYYMSPEQCQGKKVDHKTDVYSFGILAFQVLTGKLPFTGDSFMQVMFAHVSSPAPVPSEHGKGLPAAVDAPILAMLAKEPEARPESCGKAVEAIAHAAQSAGITLGTLPMGTPSFATGGMTPPSAAFVNAQTAVADGPTTLSAAETVPGAPQKSRAPLLALLAVAGLAAAAGIAFVALKGPPAPEAATADTAPAATSVPATPPPVESAPLPKPSASAPALSTKVKLTVQSKPERVDVYLGDEKLGTSPDDPIELPRGDESVELTIKAAGYLPSKIEFKPAADGVVSVKLVAKGGGKQQGTKPPVEF
jgi:serine/threonine protein kinase